MLSLQQHWQANIIAAFDKASKHTSRRAVRYVELTMGPVNTTEAPLYVTVQVHSCFAIP